MWRLVTGLALVMTATACGGHAADETKYNNLGGAGKPTVSLPPLAGGEPLLDRETVETADPRSVAFPLAAYVWDDASARTVSRARIIAGDKCMSHYGFSPVPGWLPEGVVPLVGWTRYGLWDPAALVRGYSSPQVNGGNPYPVRYLGADANAVYFGMVNEFKGEPVPAGGCQTQEYELVMRPEGLPDVNPQYVKNLDVEALTRARQDSRVVAALAQWRACMKNSGWDYADVEAPFSYWSSRRGNDKFNEQISEAERKSARADLICKKSTNLLGIWLAADVAYERAVLEREGATLREYQSALHLILGQAGKIISAG